MFAVKLQERKVGGLRVGDGLASLARRESVRSSSRRILLSSARRGSPPEPSPIICLVRISGRETDSTITLTHIKNPLVAIAGHGGSLNPWCSRKRSADTALMPPPPLTKRQKRPAKVVDEDVYADAVSHIIARDFFPGLLETEAQQDYMQALESNNSDWIRDSGRRLTQVMTPGPDGRRRGRTGTSFTPRRTATVGDTPRSFSGETPLRTPMTRANDDFAPEENPEVDVNMSLGAFQAKYTSEDNESFNALLDNQNEKRAAKYGFFHHGNKIPSARQIAHRAREQRLLENGINTSTALITTNSIGRRKNSSRLGWPVGGLGRPTSFS